jgi:antitoxin component YwqK of YwqJK toxin-antitoxin module
MNKQKKITCLTILIFLILFESTAQKTEKFYDYKWKECTLSDARFYSVITNTDSSYYRTDYYIKEGRIQMTGNYSDSLCKIKNGNFAFYYANNIPESYGKYIQNKKDGIWLSFHNNGIMKDSTVYLDGKQIGKSLSWYSNSYPSDSTVLNKDRSGVHVSWFDNGVPSEAGRYAADMKQQGKWKYFHKNGNVSSIETYDKSKLIDRQYFDENGELITDTTCTDRQAQFNGGIEAWLKYISKHIYFPTGYKIINADAATVVVTFTVNEDGEIENVYTSTPFDKVFNSIAEKAIRKSPKWIPGMEHNRRIKYTFSQAINFKNYIE